MSYSMTTGGMLIYISEKNKSRQLSTMSSFTCDRDLHRQWHDPLLRGIYKSKKGKREEVTDYNVTIMWSLSFNNS